MSEIVQDKESISAINSLLKDWGVNYLVKKEILWGGYDEYRAIFNSLSFDGDAYKTPEDYLTKTLERYLVSDDNSKTNSDWFKLKELLYRTGFVVAYG